VAFWGYRPVLTGGNVSVCKVVFGDDHTVLEIQPSFVPVAGDKSDLKLLLLQLAEACDEKLVEDRSGAS